MSKEKILAAIRANKPESKALPEVPLFPREMPDLVESFVSLAEASASSCVQLPDLAELPDLIRVRFPDAVQIASGHPAVAGQVDLRQISDPATLQNIDLAILPGQLGVAENAAVWLSETECIHRVLPFITQHLVLVLGTGQLVWNLHEAYQRIKIDETGFGVFIAGPSKTADIEQSLVIGAQGARSLTIVLADEK